MTPENERRFCIAAGTGMCVVIGILTILGLIAWPMLVLLYVIVSVSLYFAVKRIDEEYDELEEAELE